MSLPQVESLQEKMLNWGVSRKKTALQPRGHSGDRERSLASGFTPTEMP